MFTLSLLLMGSFKPGPLHVRPFILERIASAQASTPSAAAQSCVAFSSGGRLRSGERFVAQLPRRLELRLRPEGELGWTINVGRPGGTLDYMWVVSPPFQTAPQRWIGPGYSLSARESASFVRALRFVQSDSEYDAALKIVRGKVASPEKMAKIEQLGKGQLTIDVARFGVRSTSGQDPAGEALDWIEFKGEACVPK